MKIELRLYASLAAHMPENATGNPSHLDVREGTTIREFLEGLKFPLDKVKIVFINGVHAKGDEILKEGDKVGIFPPVAGG